MSAFNFTENKAISVPLDPKKFDFNLHLIEQNCQTLCLFSTRCSSQVNKAGNSIEVTGKEGIIGVNTETTRCSLPFWEIDDQGLLGIDLSLRD